MILLLDHQFSNGCHAPPWQQVHGDISYLDVKPFDTDKLTITANTAGYFQNKGLTQEGQINYERDGEVYPTLVALLKAKSPQFASAIEKKVIVDLLMATHCYFASLHFTSFHSNLLYFTSLHFTSVYFTSLLFTSPHFSSLLFTSLCFSSLHFTLLQFTSL